MPTDEQLEGRNRIITGEATLKSTPEERQKLYDAYKHLSSFLPIDVLKAADAYKQGGLGEAAQSVGEDVAMSLATEGVGKALAAGAKLAAPAIKAAVAKSAPALAAVIPMRAIGRVVTHEGKPRIPLRSGGFMSPEDFVDTAEDLTSLAKTRSDAAKEILQKAGMQGTPSQVEKALAKGDLARWERETLEQQGREHAAEVERRMRTDPEIKAWKQETTNELIQHKKDLSPLHNNLEYQLSRRPSDYGARNISERTAQGDRERAWIERDTKEAADQLRQYLSKYYGDETYKSMSPEELLNIAREIFSKRFY